MTNKPHAPIIMDVTITLKAITQGDEVILHLKDNEGHEHDKTITSEVTAGGKVTWKLAPNSNIQEIVKIYPKDGSQNIFSTKPHAVEVSTDWEGIVDKDASGSESYNIDFRYKKDNKVYTDDPEADVRPPIKTNR
jgi:hypothetical protein